MSMVTTPHINAEADAFGKTVLMPGDPLRSQFIAQNYLENAVLVNNIRGIQGYTGTYKGTKVWECRPLEFILMNCLRFSMWKILSGLVLRAQCRSK